MLCKWLDIQVFSDKAPSPTSSVLHGQQGTLKEPTHLSKRVGGVVPGVVVYLLFHCTFHAWAGWVSEIKYGLIAAARGAFTS